MSHDVFGSSRRRRRWVLPALVAVVLVGMVLLSQLATPASPLLTEDVRTQMLDVSRPASVFQDVVARAGNAERVELTTITTESVDTLAAVRDELNVIADPPPEVLGVLTTLDLALQSWTTGVAAFTDTMLAAADGDMSPTLSDHLLDGLLELRAGDRLYARAVAALAAADITQPVSGMPEIAFLPAGYPIGPASVSLIAQARALGSPLALQSALAIEQVTTVPEWVLDTADALVVDATEQLTVRVVVTNAGNEGAVPTGLTLEVAGGDGSAQSQRMDVPALEAGAKTTITFDPLSVTPGRQYSLVARLDLAPGEAETSDNSRTLAFRVNEAAVEAEEEEG